MVISSKYFAVQWWMNYNRQTQQVNTTGKNSNDISIINFRKRKTDG